MTDSHDDDDASTRRWMRELRAKQQQCYRERRETEVYRSADDSPSVYEADWRTQADEDSSIDERVSDDGDTDIPERATHDRGTLDVSGVVALSRRQERTLQMSRGGSGGACSVPKHGSALQLGGGVAQQRAEQAVEQREREETQEEDDRIRIARTGGTDLYRQAAQEKARGQQVAGAEERWEEHGGRTEEGARRHKRTGQTRAEQTATKRRRIHTAKAAAAAAAEEAEPETEEQRAEGVRRFIERHRNSNTSAAYRAAWNGFVAWMTDVENPQRVASQQVEAERPSETDIASYMAYMVTVKETPIGSVTLMLSAVADRMRFDADVEYHPWRGPFIDAMRKTLTPLAPKAQQKRAMSWTTLGHVAAAALEQARGAQREAERQRAWRDHCMIMLAYHCFLRTSEVARMRMDEVSFAQDDVAGERTLLLRVHVNRACKNDAKREGHERLVAAKREDDQFCMVRCMQQWLQRRKEAGAADADPLFPKEGGGFMAADTPRGRLMHWLRETGEADVSEYGFHSLRAGAVTEAASKGVPVQLLQQHGNWRSNAVYLYIRPSVEDRTRVAAVLGC